MCHWLLLYLHRKQFHRLNELIILNSVVSDFVNQTGNFKSLAVDFMARNKKCNRKHIQERKPENIIEEFFSEFLLYNCLLQKEECDVNNLTDVTDEISKKEKS